MDEQETNPLRQVRAHAKKLEKQLAELKAFKREWEVASQAEARGQVFSDAGLNPKWATLFPQDQDLDPETAKAWAAEQGLAAQEPEQPEPPRSQGFVTPTMGGVPAAPPAITMDDINAAIARGDDDFIARVAAEEAGHPGRIQWNHPEAHS